MCNKGMYTNYMKYSIDISKFARFVHKVVILVLIEKHHNKPSVHITIEYIFTFHANHLKELFYNHNKTFIK